MSAQQYAEQGAREEWEAEQKEKEAEYLRRLTDKFPGIPTSWPMPKPKEEKK